jgi:hypothetical protein
VNNYDDFISQISEISDFPQDVYGKVRFRIVAKKITLPAATAFLFLLFAGIVSFSMNQHKQQLDWNFSAEEMIFAHNNNFYALFDD